MILDAAFLRAFGVLIAEVLFLAGGGGLLGMALGNILIRSSWVSQSISGVLKYASWAPFFIFFALPLGPDTILSGTLITGISAVCLYTCSYALSLWIAHRGSWYNFITEAAKGTILQALLFCLFSQVHSQIGWIRIFIQKPRPDVIYSAILLLIIFLFLLDRLFRSTFDRSARAYGAILRAEAPITRWISLYTAILFSSVCFVFWQFAVTETQAIWRDLFVSSAEIWTGVLLSGALSLVLLKVLSPDSFYTRLLLCIISITSMIPIVLPMLLPLLGVHRLGDFSLSTIISIACLTLFPFLRALWALRDQEQLAYILTGVKDVLPLAFVGMLFGELYGAVAGVGFRVVSEHASGKTANAMIVSLGTLLVFLLFVSILDGFAKLKGSNGVRLG